MDQQGQPFFGGQGYANPSGSVVYTSNAEYSAGNKKKVFVIIGVLLGISAIVAVAVFFFMGGGSKILGSSSLQGFDELKEFIENGDEETQALFGDSEESIDEEEEDEEEDEEEVEESEEAENYIMAIRIAEKGETAVRAYYKKLGTLEQEFYNKSGASIDPELLSEFGNALKVLRNAIDYYDTKDGLIAAYEKDGESGAEAYFSENVECNKDDDDDELVEVCELEERYFKSVLQKQRVFSVAGCYKDGFYDVACAMEYYGMFDYYKKVDDKGNSESLGARLANKETQGIINNDVINEWGRIDGE